MKVINSDKQAANFIEYLESIDRFRGNTILKDTILSAWGAIEQKNFAGPQLQYVNYFAKLIQLHIVGGVPDIDNKFLECGALFKSGRGRKRLAGSCVLVEEGKVLTAKHVLDSRISYYLVLGANDVRRFDFDNPPAGVEIHEVKDSQINRFDDRDLAVIHLKKRSSFAPTDFDLNHVEVPGSRILSVGYGCSEDSSISNPWDTWGVKRMNGGEILRKSTLVGNDCLATSNNYEIHSLLYDLANLSNSNTDDSCPTSRSRLCHRDSGGALFMMKSGKRILIGINDRTNDENGINTHTKIKKIW